MKFSITEKSVLATLVFYDCFGVALTGFEVFRYCFNLKQKIKDLTLDKTIKVLDRLTKENLIDTKNGFYFLRKKSSLYSQRINKIKISEAKWKILRKIAKWFSIVPYVRCVFVSGALAINNADHESDLDVLIITKPGRIWTARLGFLFTMQILGKRRRRIDEVAINKVCANHFISQDSLEIPYHSIYTANVISNLVPILGSEKDINDFYDSNYWIKEYVLDNKNLNKDNLRTINERKIFVSIKRIKESILSNGFGDLIEKILKSIQLNKIKKNKETYELGGRVVATDKQLEFHPRSAEAKIIRQFNEKTKKLGLTEFINQKDSGLNGAILS